MEKEALGRILEAQKRLYVKPDDKILFVVDETYQNAPIADVFGNEYDVVYIPQVERPGQDYGLDERLMEGKTVAWLISNISITHAPSTGKMLGRGLFLISNPGITADWTDVLDAKNQEFCRKRANEILELIGGDIGDEVHITAGDETDLRLKVPTGNWQAEVGTREGEGTNGLYGELFTSPYWAEGIYVLRPGDFLTNPINEVVDETRLTIKNNFVIKIEGGEQAEKLRELLAQPKTPLAFSLGEFAFGINPGNPAKIYRSVVAEKINGGIHLAIGTNSACVKKDCPDLLKFPFGRYSGGTHIDCIKFGAQVTFKNEDGKEVKIL